MKVLIIGYGSIGKRHAKILLNIKKIRELKILTSQKNIPFKTIKQINKIKEYNPDYIVICNETSKHLRYLKYIESNFKNKHILIEKPVFEKFHNIRIVKNKVFVGYNLRFHPLLNILKENIKNRKIWSVQIICGSYLPSWRKNIDYKKSYSSKKIGGGVILDLSHELDYAVWLFGDLKPKFVINKKISDLKIQSDDYLNLFCQNEKKTNLQINLNYFMKNPIRKIFIDGSNISISLDLIKNILSVYKKEKHFIKKINNFDKNLMYKNQHEDIINKKFKKVATFKESISLMKLIERIKKVKN